LSNKKIIIILTGPQDNRHKGKKKVQLPVPQFFLADWLALRIKAQHGFVDHPQGLLEGLLEVTPDAHDLAHTLHAAANLGAHPAELAQVPSEYKHKDD
jgi:hypothetical protein